MKLINYHLSQKLKLIGMNEFNYLIYILTFSLTYRLKFSYSKGGPIRGILIEMRGALIPS
jgi:hypothetical protein